MLVVSSVVYMSCITRYKEIAAFLHPDVEKKNLARLQFIVMIAHTCRPFLIRLQARRPLAHELYDQCGALFLRLAVNVIKPEKMPKKTEDIISLDLDETENYKVAREAGYVSQLADTLVDVRGTERKELYKEMMEAVKSQLQYMKTRLPYDNKLLRALAFLHPDKRNHMELGTMAQTVASELKRFNASDRARLAVQISHYKCLPGDLLPPFDSFSGRVDMWWSKVFSILTDQLTEPPAELILLVKLSCTLSHGQAAVESGFSNTKYVVEGRNQLSDESVKGQKLIIGAVRAAGGAHLIPVTSGMLSAVKFAHAKKVEDDRKENELKRMAEDDAVAEKEAKKKKLEEDEVKKGWEAKKKTLEDKLKIVAESIKHQNDSMKAAFSRGGRIKDSRVKDSCFGTIENCQAIIQAKMEEQKILLTNLAKLMAKKPKNN